VSSGQRGNAADLALLRPQTGALIEPIFENSSKPGFPSTLLAIQSPEPAVWAWLLSRSQEVRMHAD